MRGSAPWRQKHAGLEHELGLLMRAGFRAGVHRPLGYGSFREYMERLFGFTGRQTAERLRVADALSKLPTLAQALARGALCFSVVRELTRVAVVETEGEWRVAAQGKTAREVERMVAGRSVGDRPGDRARPEAQRRRIVLEVAAPTWALWEETRRALVTELGSAVDDDALVTTMTRRFLGQGTDAGRSNYQIAVTVCEQCGLATQKAGAEEVVIDEAAFAVARCDAQHVGSVAGASGVGANGVGANGAGASVAGANGVGANGVGANGVGASGVGAEVAGANGADEAGVAMVARAGRATTSAPLPRASQAVPPAVRRAVVRRHGGRCAVPGCRHSAFVDVHHVTRRADGGGHDADNLVLLCGAHHAAVHDGRLVVRGRFSLGLRFEHADGTAYGARESSPLGALAFAQALSMLVGMGFKQGEAQQMVDGARPHVGASPGVQEVLRRALQRATAPWGASVREARVDYGERGGRGDYGEARQPAA